MQNPSYALGKQNNTVDMYNFASNTNGEFYNRILNLFQYKEQSPGELPIINAIQCDIVIADYINIVEVDIEVTIDNNGEWINPRLIGTYTENQYNHCFRLDILHEVVLKELYEKLILDAF